MDSLILFNVKFIDNAALSEVPEPSTWLLFGSGLAGFAAFRLRSKTTS